MNNYVTGGTEDFASAGQAGNIKKRGELPGRLLLSAVVFGGLFSYLFAKQYIGLNMAVFVLLIYAFAWFNRKLFIKKTFKQAPWMYLFLIPVIFLSVYFFIGNTVLNGLSVLVILVVIFAQYVVLSGNARYPWFHPWFISDMFFGAINRMFCSCGYFFAGSVNYIFKNQSERKKGALIGTLVGVGLLVIIVPVLIASDADLSNFVGDAFANIYLGDAFLYIILFLIGAAVITGPVASAGREEFTGKREAKQSAGTRPVQGVTTGVALSMISFIYVLFAIIQFRYFFLPENTIASVLGLTSSAYAVRGFGELLMITCLNFIMIALAQRFTKQENAKSQKYLKVLYVLLIVFNFIIMASAHLRMQCYETAYGYTVARFLSHSFMIFLMILNAIMLVRVFTSKVKVIKLFAAAALAYYCVIVAINPELFVTSQNIQRYRQTEKIDTEYLFWLTDVSEACDFVLEHPEEFSESAKLSAETQLSFYDEMYNEDWQSFNLAKQQEYLKLKQLLE